MGKLRMVLRVATLGALLLLPTLVLADTTNIQATVTVSMVTNVTEVEVEWAHPQPQWQMFGGSAIINMDKGPAMAKVITTNIIELTTLSFDWKGETRKIYTENTRTNWSVLWRLQSTWVPTTEPPKEPDLINPTPFPGIKNPTQDFLLLGP